MRLIDTEYRTIMKWSYLGRKLQEHGMLAEAQVLHGWVQAFLAAKAQSQAELCRSILSEGSLAS